MFIIFIWIPGYNLTKHIAVKHPIIELHHHQEIIFDLLKGPYLVSIGNKDLKENVIFPFSISGTIMTSSMEFSIERAYSPPKDYTTELAYLNVGFGVEESGPVTMIFNVSMPKKARLYLHLHGVE